MFSCLFQTHLFSSLFHSFFIHLSFFFFSFREPEVASPTVRFTRYLANLRLRLFRVPVADTEKRISQGSSSDCTASSLFDFLFIESLPAAKEAYDG